MAGKKDSQKLKRREALKRMAKAAAAGMGAAAVGCKGPVTPLDDDTYDDEYGYSNCSS